MVVINYNKEWSDDICILAIVNMFISTLELLVSSLFARAMWLNLWSLLPIVTYGVMASTLAFMICIVIEFYADYHLILATRETEFPHRAITKSIYWRSFNVTMITMEAFCGLAFFVLGNVLYVFSFLCVLIRMVFIFVVSRYIRQLERNNGASGEKPEDTTMHQCIASLPTEDTQC